jgi:hypothetical protein
MPVTLKLQDLQVLLSLVIVSAVVLAGCAAGPQYRATARSPIEGAQVYGSTTPSLLLTTDLMVLCVDGVRVSSWQGRGAYPVLVDPGLRMLTVLGVYLRPFSRGEGQVELKAMLQAAHAYQIQLARKETLLTFWVEDVTTHDEASDRQTTNASVGFEVGSVGLF